MQTISSMLQLCATLLNQADERSVSSIDFLTSATGTILAGFFAGERAGLMLEGVILSNTRDKAGVLGGAT
ncbi:hypothetical protein JK621_13530 [Serratia plymuthica]|uniref:hypothetical protein n=1 Tax=Serratia plymuthica TaxID=82996 RepID=UPI001BB01FEA|nr:hypothetical protein [Serratia plymuthica]QUY46490.1 hypothetical protein JK621_13530 [Serratia plymuthica]